MLPWQYGNPGDLDHNRCIISAISTRLLAVHRVCPGSYSFLTELSQHEADRGEAQERQGLSVEALPILGQAAAAVEPRDGAFDDPSLGQDRKALCDIGALDDLHVDLPEDFAKGRLKDRPLIAAVAFRETLLNLSKPVTRT
jgi:hypothetical protein